MLAMLAFVLGFVAGIIFMCSGSPYASVITSYLNLHVWHRWEAMQLQVWMDRLRIPLTFTSEREQLAVTTTVVGAVSWLAGRNIGKRRELHDA